ncbi:tetratricopeptide repeat protein [Sphaerisporangium sp. NPDC005288]|uniref:tetratricopeptide repeat protein n=1 Tax=Sphaerisporangium sp. NPDC005288 TaxID=3155114 RepID=UPI0033B7C60E
MRLVLIVLAVLLAGGGTVLTRIQVPLVWSLILLAASGACVTVLLPLVLDQAKALRDERTGVRALKAEADVWCRVSDMTDPVRLGVHPALTLRDKPGGRPRRMPAYVGRDIDGELDEALRDERLVIVLGESATGKSRVAFEALHRNLADHWILIPRSTKLLRELVDTGHRLRNTVIWLDELEHYLGTNGLDPATLDGLTTSGNGVVVLATMRTAAYAEHGSERRRGSSTGDDPRTVANLLDFARILRLGRWPLSAAEERRAAELARRDPSIAAALNATATGIGFAEFLAAAPRLWDRWRDGHAIDVQPVGAAIVSAAIDCRRAGMAGAVPEELLRGLYRLYLDERTVVRLDPDAFETGLAWATEPVHATSALLTRLSDGYRVFGYLVDRMQRAPAPPAVPEAVWDRLVEHLPPGDVWQVGVPAYHEGREAVARRAFEKGVEAGGPVAALAVHGLGLLAWREGEVGEAEERFRQALNLVESDGLAMAAIANSLGHLLRERGSIDDARTLLRQAADLGYVPAIVALGHLLYEQGDQEAAEAVFRRAMEAGSSHATVVLGWLLAQREDWEEAARIYRRAMGRGSVDAAARLGKLLRNRGEVVGAGECLEIAAKAGDLDAANDLGQLLLAGGHTAEGRRWLAHAADFGDAAAAYNLGMFLLGHGEQEEAERRLRQSARSGGLIAAFALAALLVDRDDLVEAAHWYRQVAQAPEHELRQHESELGPDAKDLRTVAIMNLGHLASRAGEMAKAEQWFEEAAATGHPEAVTTLSEFRQWGSELTEQMREIRRAAERGDPAAAYNYATWHIMCGRLAEADRWLRPLMEAGDEPARLALAENHHSRGDLAEAGELIGELVNTRSPAVALGVATLAARIGLAEVAKQALSGHDPAETADGAYLVASLLKLHDQDHSGQWFLERAAEGGHLGAMTECAVRLMRQGRHEEAEPLLRRAAEGGHHDAQYNLGYLFRLLGRLDEAEHWYRRAADAGHLYALNNLGVLLFALKRWNEAEPFLRRSAATGDHDAETNLGILLLRQNKRAEAVRWLRRASDAGHQIARLYLRGSS